MCNQNTSFNEYDIEQKMINSINYEKNVSHAAYTMHVPWAPTSLDNATQRKANRQSMS